MPSDGYLQALLNLLFPERPACLLCGQPFLRGEEAVCQSCTRQVRLARPPFCRVCGRELVQPGICHDCRRRTERFFLRAVSYGPYEGKMRDLIWKLKQDRRQELIPVFAAQLAEVWAQSLASSGIDALVPVPIRAKTLRERGFNQAERMAAGLGKLVGLSVIQALGWQGAPHTQATQTRRDRLQLADHSLVLTDQAAAVQGLTVCLIDDVYTTGTTANLCAKRLHEAGARTVYVLTAAR